MLTNMITNNLTLIILALSTSTILLLITLLYLMIRLSKYNKNLRQIFKGKEIEEIDKVLVHQEKAIEELYNVSEVFKKNIEILSTQQRKAYQHSNILKYDAFEELGGKMSFVLVMLDDHKNGFILNSIHNNAGCYNYLKEIKNGKCEKLLSKEEKVVLEQIV